MKRSTGILLCLIVLEAVVCGVVIAGRLQRAEPVLPGVVWDDPLIAGDLENLADAARSGSSEDWQRLAEAYLGQGLYSLAEIHYREALALDPENHAARFGMAFCMGRTGRTQESTREFQELVERIGEDFSLKLLEQRSRYQIGRNFLRETKTERAEQSFRENIDYRPAEYQYAKQLIRSGRVEKAVPIIQDNLRETPQSMGYLFLAYRAMTALDRPREAWQAADKLQRSVRNIPTHIGTGYVTPFYKRLGLEHSLEEYNSLIPQGNMDLLASKLEEILDVVEGERSPYVKLGLTSLMEVELQRKNPRRMRELLERMHALGFYNADLLQFAGAAAAFSGEMDTAMEFWQRAVRMSPNIQLHLRVAEIFDERGDAGERDFHVARGLVLRGLMLYRGNQVREAAEMLEQALELNPEDAQGWFYLAQSRRVMRRHSEARQAYERCLELDPNHGRARRQLERLADGGGNAG